MSKIFHLFNFFNVHNFSCGEKIFYIHFRVISYSAGKKNLEPKYAFKRRSAKSKKSRKENDRRSVKKNFPFFLLHKFESHASPAEETRTCGRFLHIPRDIIAKV